MVARAKTITIEAAEEQFLFTTVPCGDQALVCTFSRMARERPYTQLPDSIVPALACERNEIRTRQKEEHVLNIQHLQQSRTTTFPESLAVLTCAIDNTAPPRCRVPPNQIYLPPQEMTCKIVMALTWALSNPARLLSAVATSG